MTSDLLIMPGQICEAVQSLLVLWSLLSNAAVYLNASCVVLDQPVVTSSSRGSSSWRVLRVHFTQYTRCVAITSCHTPSVIRPTSPQQHPRPHPPLRICPPPQGGSWRCRVHRCTTAAAGGESRKLPAATAALPAHAPHQEQPTREGCSMPTPARCTSFAPASTQDQACKQISGADHPACPTSGSSCTEPPPPHAQQPSVCFGRCFKQKPSGHTRMNVRCCKPIQPWSGSGTRGSAWQLKRLGGGGGWAAEGAEHRQGAAPC